MLKFDYDELKKKYNENQNELDDYINKYNELNNIYKKTIKKLGLLEKELDNNEKEKNKLLKENHHNKKIIISLKEEINKLNDENNKTQKSVYEDEIVIVNKECTYNRGATGTKFSGSMKKEIGLTQNDIFKYHEIIQDLSNMILIYETYIFNKKIKPKNNNELIYFLIVQYINKKIKQINLNTFIKLLLYKERKNKNSNNKINTYFKENVDDNINKNKNDYLFDKRYRKGYFNRRNKDEYFDKTENLNKNLFFLFDFYLI